MSFIMEPVVKLANLIESLNEDYNSYSLEELKEMGLMKRLTIYDWRFEGVFVVIMILVFLFYYVGLGINKRQADKLFNSFNDYLKDELKFARVAFSDKQGRYLGYADERQSTWFTTFATGRSAIECVTMRAHMYARNNPFAILIESVLGFFFPSMVVRDLEEYAEVVITPNGVYAASETSNININTTEVLNNMKFTVSIVNKSVMNDVRREYYFLSVTHTTENSTLPFEYVYMSEINQLNGFFSHYAKNEDVKTMLTKASKFLKFISFTDLPSVKPLTEAEWEAGLVPKAIVRVSLPKSNEDIELLKQIVSFVVQIYDTSTKELVQKSANKFITPELIKKSNHLRHQELEKILKAVKQVEQEALQEKKQEEERERRRQLKDSGELAKQDQKMKEKRERRQRNKQKMRM